MLELKEKTKKEILFRHAQLPEFYQQRRQIPVSVKTRIGFDMPCVEDWIPYLLEKEISTLSIHGRTLKQLYGGQANWEEIAKVVEIAKGTDTIVLGNGDINTVEDFATKVQASGVDGVLIGRATQGDPWFLQDLKRYRDEHLNTSSTEPFQSYQPTLAERVEVAIAHAKLFEQFFPEEGFLPMRKHMAWYIKGAPNASDYRVKAVLANSAAEVEAVLTEYLNLSNS